METWEYKIVNVRALVMWLGTPVTEGPDAEEQLDHLLNGLGSEGWEVFNGPQNGWIFMKRPRPA